MKKIKPIHINMRKLKTADRRMRQYAGLPHCDGAMEAVYNFLKSHPEIDKEWIKNIRKRIKENKK